MIIWKSQFTNLKGIDWNIDNITTISYEQSMPRVWMVVKLLFTNYKSNLTFYIYIEILSLYWNSFAVIISLFSILVFVDCHPTANFRHNVS